MIEFQSGFKEELDIHTALTQDLSFVIHQLDDCL